MGYGNLWVAAKKCAEHARLHDENLRRKELRNKEAKQKVRNAAIDAAANSGKFAEIPDTVQVSEKYLTDIQKRLYWNDDYGDFYIQMADECNLPVLYNTGVNVKNCHKHWFGDWYTMQRVFDVHSLSLCHNRYCANCNHLKQATRLKQFTPVLQALQHDYDFYHLTQTVPNCSGADLPQVLDAFYEASRKTFRYFAGTGKIKGVDFAQYGFYGALRNLEIVVNETDYHAHFHNLLVLKKDLPLYKLVVNDFSFKKGTVGVQRKFSELEILLQKILYLAYTGQKVSGKAIEAVPRGYSCTLDKVEGDSWHEVFKYTTKFSKDGCIERLTYRQFKDLYFALKKRHVFQGYGCFYKMAKEDCIDDEITQEYYSVLARLRAIEDPVVLCRELDVLQEDCQKGHLQIISKYIIQQMLNNEAETVL